MKSFCIFVSALEYIEENLCEPITQDDIASHCYCSLSALQKIWKYCSHTSLKEYISKRRLTKCAEELLGSDETVMDIALRYRYNSPEVFCRAFKKLWGVSPSTFRVARRFTGMFPKIVVDENKIGGNYMGKKFDISQLYEILRSKAETYVLCFDIEGLSIINNNIGINAGDAAIREAICRIDNAAGDDMTAFRVGGDEFVLVTGLTDKDEVNKIADKVLSKNGNVVMCGDVNIEVSLRAGAVKYFGEHFNYKNLFDTIQNVIEKSRGENTVTYFD